MIDNTYDYSTSRLTDFNRLIVRVNPALEYTIEEIVNYINECTIEVKKWQHNIHPEISYDYCPYNSGGYRLVVTISFSKECYIDWFEFIFNKQLDDKRALEITLENSDTLYEEIKNKLEDKNNA